MTLVWFVEEACQLAGVPPWSWARRSQEEQIALIRAWEAHVGTKTDYVKKANFPPQVIIPTYPSKTQQYLQRLLTIMGQMDHPHRSDVSRDVMLMKTEDRRDLIDQGWKLFK